MVRRPVAAWVRAVNAIVYSRSVRRFSLPLAAVLLLFTTSMGCGDDTTVVVDSGVVDVDTGVSMDTGTTMDSTTSMDTGTTMDSGVEDTGVVDTGPEDTGPPPFGLETLVYNEDCVVEVVNPDETIDVAMNISETGCYTDAVAKTVASSLVPFSINSPLWTDGVSKRRFFAIPPGTHVGYRGDYSWLWPVGTILMKEFILQTDESDPDSNFVLETRFLVKYDPRFWRGYSYRWNAEGTDATLVMNGTMDTLVDYEVTDTSGGTYMHTHVFPARVTCLQCHAPRANGGNGTQTAQLNRDFDYTAWGGTVDNQIRTFEHIGLFDAPLPGAPEDLPRMPNPSDTSASLEERARAYLHANCAHCHRENGSAVTSTLWIPWEYTLEDSNACIGRDSGSTPGDMCETLDVRIVPGDSMGSLIRCVMETGAMPPVGTYVADPARQVVFDWIDSLASCP